MRFRRSAMSSPVQPQQGQVEKWVDELLRNPLEEWEANGALNPGDSHQNPDVALSLEQPGAPIWWPRKHPQSHQPLSPAQRRAWFLDWLAGELSQADSTRLNDEPSYRRQMIAQSLLLTNAEQRSSEIPIPDSL
jgi:hypothetical protein